MKRRISESGARLAGPLAGLAVLAACSAPEPPARPVAAPASGWGASAQIRSVSRDGARLTVRGGRRPGAGGAAGAGASAFAAAADQQGRFELRLPAPATDAVYRVETHAGGEEAPAPYRLLVAADRAGPIVLLTPGSPSLRLDHAGPLEAVDSDGRTLAVSGRVAPRESVSIAVDGRAPLEVRADADGRWTAVLDVREAGPADLTVNGLGYRYPGPGSAPAGGAAIEPGADGWRAVWRLSGTAQQSGWYPRAD